MRGASFYCACMVFWWISCGTDMSAYAYAQPAEPKQLQHYPADNVINPTATLGGGR